MLRFKFSWPALTRAEKTALTVLAAILGSGAGLRAWEHSGVELGPVKDWDTLREKIVQARAETSDSTYPCAEAPRIIAEKWPKRPSDSAVAKASGRASGSKSSGGRKTPPAEPLDVNAAPAEALERLPGIGPAMAKALVAYRGSKGPFRKPSDLLKVKGIGPKKLAALRPWIRLE
jgi:competence ComEA-like helix-hairpin-helix protein